MNTPITQAQVNPARSIIIIACVGAIVYSNTFFSPFQFDDLVYIVNNHSIKNIHDLQAIWSFCPCRFVTFFSLALNYYFSGLQVLAYHLFNLAVHLTSAFLVWRLTFLTFLTPAMKEEKISRHAGAISLWAGLIFVAHPVQTEAVTYIWQRAASMAALFYLAALCFYAQSRLLSVSSGSPRRAGGNYLCALAMTVAAMFTKENT
ncbi:MAG: tetratricopeptide repeat protein, partial [Candidatus Omnitrophica bacterium]|nr:tetratricopeptide repeat protein [Candidatus Omnitrophota bacterium]